MEFPSIFDERLLPSPSTIQIPAGIRLRPLRKDDSLEYLELLKQLTSVGFINQLTFWKRFDAMKKAANSYYIVVLEKISTSKIVGAGTLLIEFKYIHSAGQRGRIEDVVVDEGQRGKKYGQLLNRILVEMAKTIGVYKLSLECKTELIPFYEKFGYSKTLHFLDQRFPEEEEDVNRFTSSLPSNATCLFDERLLQKASEDVTSPSLPEGFRLRPLLDSDNVGYLRLLEQLTSVGYVSEIDFKKRFESMKAAPNSYCIVVIEDVTSSEVVGAATLVIEYKFIHECGLRGRVEDVVVDEKQRGKKFGILLNRVLVEMAKMIGVYKLSLECKTELIPFYEKFGYKENIHFMVQRFDNEIPPVVVNTD